MRTSAYTCILTISLALLTALPASAQSSSKKKDKEVIPPAPVFCGAAVMVDLAGPMEKAVSARYDQLEVGARLNFRDHYFPIAELGIGEGGRSGQDLDNKTHARAPYFRVGMDYNMNKKHNGNRLMLGLRYGFSSYKYDFTAPEITDEVWGGSQPLDLTGQKGRSQWVEACIGCETKLWSFVRLGWNLRYKFRLHQSISEYGAPWYTPGFGRNASSVFGGTLNLIFDVSRTKKKDKTKKPKSTKGTGIKVEQSDSTAVNDSILVLNPVKK